MNDDNGINIKAGADTHFVADFHLLKDRCKKSGIYNKIDIALTYTY